MPIQLDKILADIAEEKPLHPYNEASTAKKEQDDAWIRVGKKNKLSAHEAKSIFKVLQKKYEQEKLKAASTWKLYQLMQDICNQKEEDVKPKIETEEPTEMEEDAFVEFLEVRDEDDEEEEGDSDNQDKSMKSNSSTGSPEKENNPETKPEPKVLNTQMMIPQATMPTVNQQNKHQMSAAFTNALQKKGISMRKTPAPGAKPPPTVAIPNTSIATKAAAIQSKPQPENPRSIILTDNMKRKLQNVERQENGPTNKKSLLSASAFATTQPQQASSTTQTLTAVQIKEEVLDDLATAASAEPINVITIPPNLSSDLSNGITTIKTNGFNTRIGELDFQKDIIFDNNPSKQSNATGEIINIGNFDNQLPPTFFKNLCNSNRHEALGLYVANVMNRVTGKTAMKLEMNILKAIIDAQSDELGKP